MFLFNSINTKAQVYIGETLSPQGYQYMKLEVKEDSCYIAFPYESRQKHGFELSLEKGVQIQFKTGADLISIVVEHFKSDEIKLRTDSGQAVTLTRQSEPVSEEGLNLYTGSFSDVNGKKAIVYNRHGYLHLMSPYTEKAVSLKALGSNKFWSTSGEKSQFYESNNGRFNKILISNRYGKSAELHRSFDYIVEEGWILVEEDSVYYNIFLPDIQGSKPACLLLPGGGAQSQIENHKFEARLFASHGIVAMTFDKESVGKSKGQSFENYTFKEKALRYQQVFNYLKSHERVDAKKVGIHGPSEGGRLALMMGINLGDSVAFINATAAPIMTAMEGQLYAVNNYSRNLGMSESEIVTTLQIWHNYYTGIINQKIDTKDFEKIRELRKKYSRAFLPPPSDIIPLSPKREDLLDNSIIENAHRLKCPIFLQYGENDQRVDPIRSMQNFYSSIPKNLNITSELYDRGNHSMMTPEYQICSGYSYDKITWLKSIGILQ